MMSVRVVRAKGDVKFDRIAPAGFRILSALDLLTSKVDRDLLITSGTDFHLPPDPHALGEAYDLSVVGWSVVELALALRFLRLTLGDPFTILYEVPVAPEDATLRSMATVNPHATGAHLHIQRKKGTTYPPVSIS